VLPGAKLAAGFGAGAVLSAPAHPARMSIDAAASPITDSNRFFMDSYLSRAVLGC
jgi:hypothetical protein